jgi:phosphoglycerol transferase MdoB-like AlkP superfamily enzyme
VLNNYFAQILLLLKRLLPVYLLYIIGRILFVWLNLNSFQDLELSEFIIISVYALRFDTFSVLSGNALFIFLSILPVNTFNQNLYQNLLKWVYGVSNTVFLLFNLIDIAYYPYIKKRSTADILKQAGGQTDLGKLLPQYIADYWYIPLLTAILIYGLMKWYNRIQRKNMNYHYPIKSIALLFFAFTSVSAITVIGIRGGLQRIPIDVVDAGKYTEPKYISILLNTPFTIIKSLEKDELQKLDFGLTNEEMRLCKESITRFKADSSFKPNIIILMLESFSKEYTAIGQQKSFTPFFDSLLNHSLVFTNAFANGHKSIEGIPAILSSMPSLMENPFINSAYSGNHYSSLAQILKDEGYATAFFHGGINGTMNFDSYAKQAGYAFYFGKNEYNNDKDFDGYWGIWDEQFFGFTVNQLNSMSQPFHASLFSLSSHHPYQIPEQYKGKFDKGFLEIHESIGYADYALKTFFENASKQKWFKNTLFVLCADHTSLSRHPFYTNNIGQFAIPVAFYMPDRIKPSLYPYVFQQTDIMPSILDFIGYESPFCTFGKSYKDSVNRFACYYTNSTHYMLTDSLLLNFSNYKLNAVYQYRNDSLMQNNIISSISVKKEENMFKCFIQRYNNSLIDNTCVAK